MSNFVRLAVAIPAPTAEPRGAKLAAAAAVMVWRALSGLWRRQPPAAPSASEEARRVREMATQIRSSDPGFAADLFAAADRHEVLHEGR